MSMSSPDHKRKVPSPAAPTVASHAPRRGRVRSDVPDGIPPAVRQTLRSSGEPLDSQTRIQMQQRFGHDFTQVRIHTEARAAESADSVIAESKMRALNKEATEPAVRTGPNVAEARNRRVEILLSPAPAASGSPSTESDVPPASTPPARKPFDLTYHPPIRPETPSEHYAAMDKAISEADKHKPKTSSRSILDTLNSKMDEALNPLIKNLPDWMQGLIRDGAHAAVERGVMLPLDQVLDQNNVSGNTRNAIVNAAHAVLQTKF